MKILLENAGVQTGCLLLHTPNSSGELGTFTIAIDSRNNTYNLYPDKIISESVPESLLYYVARTKQSICLDHPDMSVLRGWGQYYSIKPENEFQ
jgi:hypothetical protein